MNSELKTKSLKDLSAAYLTKELQVNPEYQRGLQWGLGQKQGLIDSLLRGYQIPIFYIHLETRTNNYTQASQTTAWIVDGQQRLASIVAYCQNEFSLPDPKKAKPGTIVPVNAANLPQWTGKKFQELEAEDRERLLAHKLLIVEIVADKNEVRDLFIRLQAGTPLTAQEKRDAWPGDFTNFVIQHAGKPGHRLSNPKPYFSQFRKANAKRLTVADGEHYVDGHAEMRKFFAGLAMTLMLRERSEIDFVDLKGKTINDFYLDNLDLPPDDAGALRVVQLLDRIVDLPNFAGLTEGGPITFQMAFHFALLVDALDQGNYTNEWKSSVVEAFLAFKAQVAAARLHHRETRESPPHHEKFGQLLSGSGSDTAELIRLRHAFMLSELYPKIKIVSRDPTRGFDLLEREVIWNRDRGQCQNPECSRPDRRVAFRDARIHHIVEHSTGGPTILRNGVLICPECHTNRASMQSLTTHFQEHIARMYDRPQPPVGELLPDDRETDLQGDGNGGTTEGVRIVIDWGALDIDRPTQIIQRSTDPDTIVEFLRLLLLEFKKPMRDQLTQLPIVRFPLSTNPSRAFLNRARNTPYRSNPIPGTDPVLYFCPHSGRTEKVERLRVLISRLTLPDGGEFPENCVTVSAEQTRGAL
jgi:hypothetical protein